MTSRGTGIYAVNSGTSSGTTRVTATSDVAGGIGYGIVAVNGNVTAGSTGIITGVAASSATNLTVEAAAVSGATAGVFAVNAGTGSTSVTTTGTVTGTTGYGVLAMNGAATLTADGTPTVVNASGGTTLTVNTASVSGATMGIYAINRGSGMTSVTATGTVTGATSDGIFADDEVAGSSLTVHTASVSGSRVGIRTIGFGTTSITASGLVEGGTAAIDATGTAGQSIDITTNGLVRNSSQSSSARAINTVLSAVTLTNNGGLLGTVSLGAAGNTFNNNAAWNTAGGSNTFGNGSQLINAAGVTITAAANGGAAETTTFNGLGSFTNRGIITLQDGGAGDLLHASGNLTSAAGAVHRIDTGPAGLSDRIWVDGTADITGTALVVANQGGYAAGTRYTVFTATGRLTGTYASVTGLGPISAFASLVATYDANNAYLDAIKVRSFVDAARTPNQIATAGGLDTIPASGVLFGAVASLANDDQARAAFDALSGEVHASVKTVLLEDSHFVRDAAVDRIRQSFDAVNAPSMPAMSFAPSAGDARPAVNAMAYAMTTKAVPMRAPEPRLAMWGQGFGSWGHTDGDGNAARIGRSTGGVVSGFDGAVAETWRLGIMGGYSHTSFDVRERSSSGQSDNYHVGVYGGTQWGALGFRGGASYTWHDISTGRTAAFAGFSDNLRANYSAGTTQVFGELGRRFDVGGLALEPFGSLAYVNLHTGAFTEQGGPAALTAVATSSDTAFITLGARASTGFMLGAIYTTARGTLGWRHAFADTTPFSTFAFAGGSAFTVAAVPVARDAALVNAGLDFAIAKAATIGLSYGGQFGANATDQNVRGQLTVRF